MSLHPPSSASNKNSINSTSGLSATAMDQESSMDHENISSHHRMINHNECNRSIRETTNGPSVSRRISEQTNRTTRDNRVPNSVGMLSSPEIKLAGTNRPVSQWNSPRDQPQQMSGNVQNNYCFYCGINGRHPK